MKPELNIAQEILETKEEDKKEENKNEEKGEEEQKPANKFLGFMSSVFTKVKEGTSSAAKNVEKGDIVLLSPGSSSQDQYKRFEDRGTEFKNIVENFKI